MISEFHDKIYQLFDKDDCLLEICDNLESAISFAIDYYKTHKSIVAIYEFSSCRKKYFSVEGE